MRTNLDLVTYLQKEGVLHSPQLIDAFAQVDRAHFVADAYKDEAYEDHALPTTSGQTISQPQTVAFMLELLQPQRGQKILDVGAGSGWTTALLAHVVGSEGFVWGLEVIPELVTFGQKNLAQCGITRAQIQQTHELGLSDKAPFDRILVSADAREIPSVLIEQLAVTGIIVIPVRGDMHTITKTPEKKLETEVYPGFAFVPLVH